MVNGNHPCYNPAAAVNHSRIHLPVVPSCNIQCKFCNRLFDCPNESRPGVTSALLSPHQAVHYLEKATELLGPFAVAGIAGPGDPFAEADLTIETFRLIRKKYPDLTLCVATNGLNVLRYANILAELKISHVSITINAVDPGIGARIVSWVRFDKHMYRGVSAAELLFYRQLDALRALHALGITVKVNTIVIPGINDTHIEEIAKTVADAGADVVNCIPCFPVAGSEFEHIIQPDHEMMQKVRWEASQYLTLVHHCARCRSDAAGLLGKDNGKTINDLLKKIASGPLIPSDNRPYIAVASREGLLVNEHLGRTEDFLIYGQSGDDFSLIDRRKAPQSGAGLKRWAELAALLHDCRALLVNQSGETPKAALNEAGVRVIITEGLINEALSAVFAGHNPPVVVTGGGCSGKAGGCC